MIRTGLSSTLTTFSQNNRRQIFDEVIIKKGLFIMEGGVQIFNGSGKILFKDNQSNTTQDLDIKIANQVTQCFQNLTVQNPVFENSITITETNFASFNQVESGTLTLFFAPESIQQKDIQIGGNTYISETDQGLSFGALKYSAKTIEGNGSVSTHYLVDDINLFAQLANLSDTKFQTIHCNNINISENLTLRGQNIDYIISNYILNNNLLKNNSLYSIDESKKNIYLSETTTSDPTIYFSKNKIYIIHFPTDSRFSSNSKYHKNIIIEITGDLLTNIDDCELIVKSSLTGDGKCITTSSAKYLSENKFLIVLHNHNKDDIIFNSQNNQIELKILFIGLLLSD